MDFRSLRPQRALWCIFGLGCILLFGTLPRGRTADVEKPFRFVVYGDTRDGHEVHRKLVKLIMEQKPEFVIQTGDLVHTGSSQALWSIYDDITREMRKNVPVYASRGNHDLGGPGYEERMTSRFTSGNKLYYSFDHGNSHFVALAVDEATPYGPKTTQFEWLEKDLAAARPRFPNIFVFFHVAPYSIGSHGSDIQVRNALCPLFVKYHVRAVFNGHDHIYYRTKRDGIHYLVSGGGGAPLYYPDPTKGALPGDKWERVNHIIVCEVNGDKVEMTALRADGTAIEHADLPR